MAFSFYLAALNPIISTMKTIKFLLTAIMLAGSVWLAKGQSCPSCTAITNCEYVCNGGFDSYSSLPTALDQMTLACGWDDGYPTASNSTPDYFHSNTSVATVSIPCNVEGIENYQFNDGYAGLWGSGAQSYRESIETNLISSLVMDDWYQLTFYISLADGYQGNLDGIFGIYFPTSGFTITINPSSASVINDPLGRYTITPSSAVTITGWTKYTIKFKAYGSDPSIRIGFMQVPQTANYVAGSWSLANCTATVTPPANSAYYYIDDVSIKRIVDLTPVASHTTGCAKESFSLSASGPDVNSFTWTPGTSASPTSSLSCYTCQNPVSIYTTNITYTVTGTSSVGCAVNPTVITIAPYVCCENTNANNITFRDVNIVPYNTPGSMPWPSTPGGAYTGIIAAPSGGLITNTLSIVSSLSVNAAVTFSNCNIAISTDKSIKQYSTTVISHSYLWGCDGLWEGWRTYNDFEIRDSWIEDAVFAVNEGYSGFSITSHPRLYIENVMFNKNWYNIAVGTTSMNPDYFRIKGCIFSCRNFGTPDYLTTTRYTSLFPSIYIKTPGKIKGSAAWAITNNTIRTVAGIVISGLVTNTTTTHFTVGDTDPNSSTNANYTNRFDYLNLGIYNANSKLNVYNNAFSNMITTSTGTAIACVLHEDNHYHTTSTRIGSSSANYYKNVFGYGTTTTLLDAVSASGGGELVVKSNDFFTISRYGVRVESWQTSAATETVLVANNSYSTTSYAFYANNNQSITAAVTSNTLQQPSTTYSATGYGAYIAEVSKPATVNYLINSNNFSGGQYSIFANSSQNVRVIDNIIQVKKPTSTGTYNGGVWIDNCNLTFVKGNAITCNPTNTSNYNTYGVYATGSPSTTVKCNTITTVGACLKFQQNCSPSTIYRNYLNKNPSDPCRYGLWIDNSGQTGNVGHQATNWEMSDDVWGDFAVADSYSQNSSTGANIYYDANKLAADYTPQTNTNSTGTPYFPVTTTITNSGGCSETSRFSTESSGGRNTNTSEELPNRFSKKGFIMKKNNSGVAREIMSNDSIFETVDSLLTLYTESKNISILNSARNLNASITAGDNIEQNQKDFNSIYCTFLESKNLVSSIQIADLHDMAVKCPFTEGYCVFQSRSLIRNWDDSTQFYNECENILPTEANSRLANSDGSESVIFAHIYPNPSDNSVSVSCNVKNCLFEISDVVGRQILSQKLPENVTKIDVTSLNNGTYLFRITNNNTVIRNGKLIISH
jgi:hypothetical protein